ncbi:class I SAM-dependent methyltransferase [Deferribacter autotrophicus]|uniref:Class I SAM-dependent methyltransferase n=1 Tax=Deferribacter autotrophicus TaxID=500465 RepID=A0A5A8F8V4_9BACT|nr:class I SAM-dependent methyltransferase [Deferribacter autotrophicus]KAA0259102.1 class I SAM-dependent methyltransferase [Deferribacter autotrophicus]
MGFDDAAINYFISSDHKEGEDLAFCTNYFKNHHFKKLLDIATAAGHFTKPFSASMKVATDISFNMLKTAKEKNNLSHLVQCLAEFLPFKGESFDIVTCRIALHHFKKPGLFFDEVYRVLNEKGFFVLIDSIVDIEDTYLNVIEYIRDNTHRRSFTISEILEFTAKKYRLLTFHTIFKKHNFIEWATRLNQDSTTVEKIEKAFLDLPAKIKDELKVETDNGRVVSYTDKKGIFIFQKL